LSDIEHRVKATLRAFIAESKAEELILLFSGGRDSTVLLELLVAIRAELSVRLRAVHVDHGLNSDSNVQAKECARVAKIKDVDLKVYELDVRPTKSQSVEEWARNERYKIVRRDINSKSLVLTAHHSNDHVETVIQRIVQGAGPYGLRGIVPLRKLGSGYIGRPLLKVSRDEITSFAREKELVWYEDPMNYELRYERTRIRNFLMPSLKSFSAKLESRLEKLSKIQKELCDILDHMADFYLAKELFLPKKLSVKSLSSNKRILRPYILRKALTDSGFPVPREKKLEAIIQQMLEAKVDANPRIKIGTRELRRYDGYIYLIRSPHENLIQNEAFDWDPKESLSLPWGSLSVGETAEFGINENFFEGRKFTIKFRKGGERFCPSNREKSNELKKLFQEWEVPPWERVLTPLIYYNDELIAVAGLGVAKKIIRKFGSGKRCLGFLWKNSIYG
jgi:tRNA(Ile)-lysidine synthase